jgi:tRNA A37 threonylcarbamoyladenosine modification protein TsaB
VRILALDAALARCAAAVVIDQQLVSVRQENAVIGHAALLPVMTEAVLDEARLSAGDLDLVAAHGIALAAGVPVVGVTVGEALADALPHLGHRSLWSVIDSRRGRVFLERSGDVVAVPLDALPMPEGGVALAGDAAPAVAARLAARDIDVMLTDARLPMVRHVAVVAEQRFAGQRPARAAQPLYVDPPEARLPAGGLRPPPVG